MRGGIIVLVAASACGRVGFDSLTHFRKTLTVDHGQVAGELADFPVLVELHDPDLAAHARPDGFDIELFDSSGNPLAYERELFAAGAFVAWVKVPGLSATTDTMLELDYGDATASDHAQPAAVWSNAFTGVYHFGDGTTLSVADSTGVNDGTNNGAFASSDAIIVGAVGFDNSAGTAFNVTAPIAGVDQSAGALTTVSFWVELAAFTKGPFAFSSTTNDVYDLWFEENGCEGFNTQGGEVLGMTATIDAGWHHVVAVFYNGLPDASHNKLYLDGAPQTLTTCVAGIPNPRSPSGLARWGGGTSAGFNYQMTGALDEGRIAHGERSPAWIQTEVANQRGPTTFVTAGPERATP
jgi:hypothetical protein